MKTRGNHKLKCNQLGIFTTSLSVISQYRGGKSRPLRANEYFCFHRRIPSLSRRVSGV